MQEFTMLLPLLLFFSQNSFQVNAQFQQTLDAGSNPPTYLQSAVVIPNPLPTLVYNCAIMPAICSNVQAWATAQNLQLPLTLHYDADTGRKSSRGSTACPDTWSVTHTCPETNQPAVHGYDRTNPALPVMVQYGTALLTNEVEFVNEIAGATPQDSSGLAYTCDEFPARS